MSKKFKPRKSLLRKRPLKIIADPALSLGDQAKEIHARVERRIKTLKLPPVSCRKGCSHCCYKLVSVGVPDALMMAGAILAKPDWRERYLPRLREAALKACDGEIVEEDWFALHIPCPVLDTEAGTCDVYGSHPTACRYHLAATPAELCDPELHPGARTGMVNLLAFENAIDKWQLDVGTDVFGTMCVAALPVMVIYCVALLNRGDSDVEAALEGITDPREWHIKHRNMERDLQRAQELEYTDSLDGV